MTYIHYFKANEFNKNMNSINKILEILLNKNFSRDDCLISIGGGITGDISGLAASLFKRGLKFINIPDKSLKFLKPFLRFTFEFFLLILSFL